MARQNVAVDKNSQEYQLQSIAGARSNLLLMLALTVVNIVMILINSNRFFLFSAFVPYLLVVYGRGMDAGLFASNTTVSLIVAGVIVAVFLLCWLLSKKKAVWLVIAAVLFALDTAALLYYTFVLAQDVGGQLLNIVLHVCVMFYLVRGCMAAKKLSGLTEEDFDDQIGSTGPEL